MIYGATMANGLFLTQMLAKKMETGLHARPLGKTRVLDGAECVAAEFPLDRDVLARTRAFYRIETPSLGRLHLAAQRRAAA